MKPKTPATNKVLAKAGLMCHIQHLEYYYTFELI